MTAVPRSVVREVASSDEGRPELRSPGFVLIGDFRTGAAKPYAACYLGLLFSRSLSRILTIGRLRKKLFSGQEVSTGGVNAVALLAL